MALLKVVHVGDELVFDLGKTDHRRISIKFSEKTGRAVAMVIRADKDIPIEHIRHMRDNVRVISEGVVDIHDEAEVSRYLEGSPAEAQ